MGNDGMAITESGVLSNLDDYEKETLFRIFIIALAVFVVVSFIVAIVFFPSSPTEPIEPPNYHTSPLPPRDENYTFWSGSEAESFSELAPCLIWGTIGVLALLTIYFAMQSRRERKGEVLGE